MLALHTQIVSLVSLQAQGREESLRVARIHETASLLRKAMFIQSDIIAHLLGQRVIRIQMERK